jgi:hypothetical protein
LPRAYPNAGFGEICGNEILNRDGTQTFFHKRQGQVLPFFFTDDSNLLYIFIILHLEGKIIPITFVIPALEILCDDQELGFTLFLDDLDGSLLGPVQLGLFQLPRDLDEEQLRL